MKKLRRIRIYNEFIPTQRLMALNKKVKTCNSHWLSLKAANRRKAGRSFISPPQF